MFSLCSQGVSSTKNPNRKTCKKRTASPGAEKLPTAPGGSWRKDVPGWEKSIRQIHGDLRPACVCPVSPPYITRVLVVELS